MKCDLMSNYQGDWASCVYGQGENVFVWQLCECVNVLDEKLKRRKEKSITVIWCNLLYTEYILPLTTEGKYPL